MDYARALRDMEPSHDFLVAIDSDGCVFDAMGIKQRECFCPMMIACFNLQPVAQAARECKEFADLFSNTRGANRHITMVRILKELLPSHPEVKRLGFPVPRPDHYFEWVNDSQSLLSNEGLKKAAQRATDPKARVQLNQALIWSRRVDEMVSEVVKNIPPFPYVRESLERISGQADIIVCSSTPSEALRREWGEHGIDKYVAVIAGQEMGKKAEHLAVMAKKYEKNHILMIGDALGDRDAAKKNGLLFYPVNPGHEEESWKKFYNEAFDRLIAGTYSGRYEDMVISEFESYLPENPPWLE